MCEQCKQEMIELLDKRIHKILAVYREDGDDEEAGIAESHCFHLMEIQRILEGHSTCGVYDDYGFTSASSEAVGDNRG